MERVDMILNYYFLADVDTRFRGYDDEKAEYASALPSLFHKGRCASLFDVYNS